MPLVVGEIQDLPRRGMASAVDDPVDPTVPVECLSDERFEIPALRNRASETETTELPGQIPCPARRRHKGNSIASFREFPGASSAHAAPGRRHHGYFATNLEP